MNPDGKHLRRSAAIRVGAAVLGAAAVTALAIALVWGPLDVRTDVVGYPSFSDFNVENYLHAYYLTVGLFPLLALGLFLALTRYSARLGLTAPPARGPLRPAHARGGGGRRWDSSNPQRSADSGKQLWIVSARTASIGALLGFEAGIAVDASSIWWWLVLGIAGYGAAALLAARLLLGVRKSEWSPRARLAAVNSLGTVLCFAGLLSASLSTQVRLLSDGSTRHYDWLPPWLGLSVAAILAIVVVIKLRRARASPSVLAIERAALLLIAAPVALVLLRQGLAGDLGVLEGFHFGEQLGGARLIAEGWFPWRDVVLTHGLLQDVVSTFGRGVFGDSVWGFLAGVSMIMTPLYLISVYFLLAYLVGRNWPLLVLALLVLIDPMLVPEHFRFILWPPILLVLAIALDRPSRAKSIGLAFLLVVQTILAPEAAPTIVAVAMVLTAYEAYYAAPGAPLAERFSRTLWVGVAGFSIAALFAVYLAIKGALDDFVYVSINLLHGLALTSGLPPGPGESISNPLFVFLALAPLTAILISVAYAFARLRLRASIYTADWVMAAPAIVAVVYYTKFLARMDTGHVYQQFVTALPLIVYIVYRAVTAADEALLKRWRGLLRITLHPASLVALIAGLVVLGDVLRDRVKAEPAVYRPVATAAPAIDAVGYTQSIDVRAYRDVSRVVDAYTGPNDTIFDFSNTPLLFHYLLDRDPSTRYFHVSLAPSAELQSDLTKRLERAKPKLIAFDDDGALFVSLSNWDGIPNMVRNYTVSQWILDHYRPLLWTHGFTFYARRDVATVSPRKLDLSKPPLTRNVPFTVQPCTWGAAPNFLSGPAMPDAAARANAVGARARIASLKGGKPIIRLELPRDSHWGDYRWLELDAGPRGFARGYFSIHDKPSRPSTEREISFETLAGSPRDYVVPVGSCSQWHAYRGRHLYLSSSARQDITAVRLIR